jgi:hypothetical protein
MRSMVKRLLKKYKYPPEGQAEALETVISQCEMWTDNTTYGTNVQPGPTATTSRAIVSPFKEVKRAVVDEDETPNMQMAAEQVYE